MGRYWWWYHSWGDPVWVLDRNGITSEDDVTSGLGKFKHFKFYNPQQLRPGAWLFSEPSGGYWLLMEYDGDANAE